MSFKHDSAKDVQLLSFSHINGDSSASSQDDPCDGRVQDIGSTLGSSKKEILGPTGTVRGYKNMIRERKDILRLSFVGETFEVGCQLKTNSLVVNYLCEQLYPCTREMLYARYILILPFLS